MSRGRSSVRLVRSAVSLTALCVFFGAFTASVAFAADDNKVIFPAGNATATSASSVPAGGGLGNVTLVVGLVLAAVGGWFVWRGRLSAPLGRDTRQLALSETRSLGNRQYLVVATYEDKKFLLGVCPGRIDLLAPLHDAPALAEKPRS
jgi:flagellar protein FliO/FliZ